MHSSLRKVLKKARYPSGSKLRQDPSRDLYFFDFSQPDNDWLRVSRNNFVFVDSDHILEHQSVQDFLDSLTDDVLPNGTASRHPSVNKPQVFQRFNTNYEAWARGYARTNLLHTNLMREMEQAMAGGDEGDDLCCLEGELNTIKKSIAARKRPLANERWSGHLRFADYNNVENIERQFCKVAAAVAYMQDRAVVNKLDRTVRRVREALGDFENLHYRVSNSRIDLVSRWEEYIQNLLATIAGKCRQWFNDKFTEFLGNQTAWAAANPGQLAEIANKVSHLQRVRERILDVLRRAEEVKDRVFG